ncbi:choline dehydrogenase [Corynebacterium xerosis]|uniref:choline dehydrogenase n=1 Tax=Corynebacterium xerosis TaxID=1725 RepID=UPI00366A8A36
MPTFPFSRRRKNSADGTVEHKDIVIVGAGSAGSVLANRLSDDFTTSVLVLEAGRMDSLWDLYIHMPSAFSFPIGNRFYDWAYESEPEPEMNGRRIYHARGKVVGGSSSINGQIYQRGNPMDYEKWGARDGLEKWGWSNVLPYFNRMENALGSDPDDPRRGHDGPLRMKRGPADSPLFKAFFKSIEQAGYHYTPDVNGYRQEGFGPFDANIDGGKRLSASRAYLHPALKRPNVELRTRAYTTRILFEGTKAVGVEYRKGGRVHQVRADKVILAGGAFNSPQLLQLSGVGDEKLLNKVGVNVVKHLPGVGENLQDHLEVYVQYNCTQPVSSQPYLEKWRWPFIGLRWILTKKGPVATSHFEGGGFARSNENEAYPNLMFHFLPLAMRYDGTKPDGDHGFQFHVGPMYSDARGHVRITSSDPSKKPEILFNYLSTEQDRREWVEAIRTSRKLLDTPAMREYWDVETSPGADVDSDEQILDWVRRDAETALHPSCTCVMGPESDEMAVVDPDTMGVHGTEGLYVVDASVLPGITNGNIYAPTMMVAEKAADLIAGKNPLEPLDLPYYRAGHDDPLDPPEAAAK